MVNVDLSPSVILGVGLIGAGVSLWQVRQSKPWISRDFDVVISCLSLVVGGILIFQGWRLDPLLLMGQLMTTACAGAFAFEALKLRSEKYQLEEKAQLQDVFRRKNNPNANSTGDFMNEEYPTLPPPPPPYGGGGEDPQWRWQPPSSSSSTMYTSGSGSGRESDGTYGYTQGGGNPYVVEADYYDAANNGDEMDEEYYNDGQYPSEFEFPPSSSLDREDGYGSGGAGGGGGDDGGEDWD